MDKLDINAAIAKGRQTAHTEMKAREARCKERQIAAAKRRFETGRKLNAEFNAACNIAEKSGLRAGLKKLNRMSLWRIRPIERHLRNGTLLIETQIPVNDFRTIPLDIQISANGTIVVRGNDRSVHGRLETKDAAVALEFVANYAQKAGFIKIGRPRPQSRLRRLLTMARGY